MVRCVATAAAGAGEAVPPSGKVSGEPAFPGRFTARLEVTCFVSAI